MQFSCLELGQKVGNVRPKPYVAASAFEFTDLDDSIHAARRVCYTFRGVGQRFGRLH